MSMVTLLAWAIACLFGAFVCYRGIDRARPWLSALALVCMLVLGAAGWRSLELLNLSMQAYAMGVDEPIQIPGSIWSLASIGVVIKYAPLWLLGRG